MTQHISNLFAPIERPALAVRSAKGVDNQGCD